MNVAQPNKWQRHRAARAMAHYASDAAELAEFLEMAGLTAEEGKFVPEEEPEPEQRVPDDRGEEPKVAPEELRRLANVLLASYGR
ncbi:hypothetical protein FHU38_002185 [Saccharomonospora amisosensis]|uniref:Uncharacterized protein n=1 Tax=Saccharomonospora amisosensis TaxID=1128677 RepID=A0A7X5UPK4_9PSEU|nr:hypothetical protein [Saccharomonospora amisosensis]NIJ11841.1 hypothetical protein [Saccharomonospora amisosensis]